MTDHALTPGPADPDDAASIRAMLRHPRFADAMRHIGSRFLALHSDYFANKQVADEGRFLVCQLAMALHADYRPEDPDSGLTLARLVKHCTAARIMPHGRVEAVVSVLRRSRRLVDAPPGGDRRIRRLEPGPLLVAECKQRVRLHFEALDMVVAGRSWLRRLDEDPGFFWAVERERGVYFRERQRLLDRLPALKAVAEIDGGYLTLVALIDAIGGPPAPVDVAFPHVAMADSLHLPRAQLRRALDALEAAGLIKAMGPAGRSIRIHPLAVETLATWHAIRLLRFDRSGAGAAALRDGAPPPASGISDAA